MILKEKNNDIALRSLSEIFDDIQTQTQTGNFGFIFSSSYTINPYVTLFSSIRNDIENYKKKGYESFLYNEEREFIEKLKDRSIAESWMIIKKLTGEPQNKE